MYFTTLGLLLFNFNENLRIFHDLRKQLAITQQKPRLDKYYSVFLIYYSIRIKIPDLHLFRSFGNLKCHNFY